MAKKIVNVLKLQIPAGGANPSPPVGPALGQVGLNIMDFCNAFNTATQESEKGMPLPVVINVYEDKSFDFVVKTPPAAVLIRKALNIQKGSGEPNRDKVGKLIYCTRTVPEMTKCVEELKKVIAYRRKEVNDHGCKIVGLCLSARRNMCIHPTAMAESDG